MEKAASALSLCLAITPVPSSSVFDPDTSDNTATELTTVNTSANLALTKSDTRNAHLATPNTTNSLTPTSTGPTNATGVSQSDAIPAVTSFVSATGDGTVSAVCV